jgi:flavin reductase (DIM6/NTAB) family NADH-FMN oxidoreductase RutF
VRPLPPRSRKTNAAMRKADMPLIANAIGHIVTRVVNAYAAGDHSLYIGEVEHLDFVDDDPLLFLRASIASLHSDVEQAKSNSISADITASH